MSFHKREHLVQAAVKRVVAQHPALADDIALLENHYMRGLPKPQPAYLAAISIVLAAPDVATAMKDVSEQLEVTHLLAESFVREGINAAPESIKAREDMLHSKGIMRGSERYFIGTRNIAPGSIYDRAWQMGNADTRIILAEAVQASIPTKGRSLGHAAFNYVAALLIPAGQERDFALNKLSLDYKRSHGAMVEQAATYIRGMASDRGLPVPAGLPVPEALRPDVATQPAVSIVAHTPTPETRPQPASHKRLGAVLKAKAEDIVVPASSESGHVLRDPDEIRKLKRDLEILKTQQKIGESAGRLYLWLHSEGKNGERTVAEAAEILKKPETVVRIMVSQVSRALRELRGGDALEGQGHQSRPVSP